jgi:hypothetical protein
MHGKGASDGIGFMINLIGRQLQALLTEGVNMKNALEFYYRVLPELKRRQAAMVGAKRKLGEEMVYLLGFLLCLCNVFLVAFMLCELASMAFAGRARPLYNDVCFMWSPRKLQFCRTNTDRCLAPCLTIASTVNMR